MNLKGLFWGISTSRTLRSWEAKPEKALKAECRAEKLTFAVVDCSGTLPVINRPASELTRSKTLEGPSQLLSELLGHSQILPRLASGYACEVWKKMMSIGEAFNRGFRQEKWRAPDS